MRLQLVAPFHGSVMWVFFFCIYRSRQIQLSCFPAFCLTFAETSGCAMWLVVTGIFIFFCQLQNIGLQGFPELVGKAPYENYIQFFWVCCSKCPLKVKTIWPPQLKPWPCMSLTPRSGRNQIPISKLQTWRSFAALAGWAA